MGCFVSFRQPIIRIVSFPEHSFFPTNNKMSADEVATAFIGHYTQTFTANRPAMTGLYVSKVILVLSRQFLSDMLFPRIQTAASTMTWEGQKFVGPEAIMGKMNVSCSYSSLSIKTKLSCFCSYYLRGVSLMCSRPMYNRQFKEMLFSSSLQDRFW
jgi:hypothetical protein